ncbi:MULTISPECIES: 1-aminocyclopropane-1-carboxylate deaminase/D-cysteine desulfhydrase [Acinetobacter]|uniref:Pyridoxal-phosphate dependent enzyme n=1 Tax=Acinetobacter junii TaxID=40215 RepID=A0AAW5RC13_ACIJU|nr:MULTISPECIES: pyridoxal-phosphate dependent enzyme [Acinetobacter]MCU4398252.1 pyridoxal-phosphate dependent enzyme [Acinetobacter junii]MDA3501597.1 pyridoxal-phosphate dependent enzyme [Acinetobacter sp. AOR34_HL]QUS49376.1 1-aminocyclopropane-1-carboxylate deaminase/D-cysteine desulfhydrase [Acinetobacter junii]QXR11375.1 pyridoxal-phosphate dependent enzyme [Acinetobacter junii]RTE46301.1 1-aminocyclopropane-1-carboxylate deaminase/D-cysteine desulfhydrase [Acinetobacter junii]
MFDQIAFPTPYQTLDLPFPVQLTVKRLDLIHPQISGNKFFKLKYNLLEAKQQNLNQVLTFGGAYSNHIAATAYAAHYFGFQSIGIIRGEELAKQAFNPTLQTAQDFGMQLHFVSRAEYRLRHEVEYLQQLKQRYPNTLIIPEGGTNQLAIQGTKEILSADDRENYDVIGCAVGTGGTIAGIIESSSDQQHILGFSALKGDFLKHDIQQWTNKTNWSLTDKYCCGGYAKTNSELLQFMQQFEQQYAVPLEQVYTAKMMMGLFDLIQQGNFPVNTRILAIHTGGLQGRMK